MEISSSLHDIKQASPVVYLSDMIVGAGSVSRMRGLEYWDNERHIFHKRFIHAIAATRDEVKALGKDYVRVPKLHPVYRESTVLFEELQDAVMSGFLQRRSLEGYFRRLYFSFDKDISAQMLSELPLQREFYERFESLLWEV